VSGARLHRLGPGALALGLAAVLLPGCWVPLERGRQMDARLARLEAQSAEQERRLEEQRELVRDRVAKADQKIAEVQAKIDELNRAARRSGADLGVSLQQLQGEFAKVKGELEVEQHRLGELEKGLAALKTETDGRFAAMRGAGALDAFEAKRRISELPKPDDRAAVLALAQELDQKGETGVAREVYEEWVRRWPQDARAADAGYRAGELLAAQKRPREALLAFGRVAEDHPRSERAPDAMLGAAEAMVELGMKDEARAVLGQLAQKYPKAPAAAKARARLAELSPAPAKPPAPKKKPAAKPAPKP
jgi:tol-pal system protein YbgF